MDINTYFIITLPIGNNDSFEESLTGNEFLLEYMFYNAFGYTLDDIRVIDSINRYSSYYDKLSNEYKPGLHIDFSDKEKEMILYHGQHIKNIINPINKFEKENLSFVNFKRFYTKTRKLIIGAQLCI